MMIGIILLGLSRIATPVQTVDLIEINHLYSDRGNHGFSQVIFWDVDPPTKTFHVREWVMLDSMRMDVTRDGMARATLVDGTVVVGRMIRELWTMTDPERDDLKVWPQEERIPLARAKNDLRR